MTQPIAEAIAPRLTAPQTLAISLCLAFVAGYVDTCGFIALFGLFTAHVTGNFVLIGAELVRSSNTVFAKLLALPTFVVAVAATRMIVVGLERSGRSPLRPLLLIQAVLLTVFMAAGIGVSPPERPEDWAEIVTGLVGVTAMAVQNTKARLVTTGAPPTTVMTGNVTQLVIDAVDMVRPIDPSLRSQAAARASKMLPPVLAFAVGSIAGAVGYAVAGFGCIALPAAALLALAVILPRD